MKKIICILLSALLLFSALCVSGCEQTEQSAQKDLEKFNEYSFDYFDTVTTISGYAESREAFDAVADDVLEQLHEYHRLFTIYHRFEGLENLCTVNELVQGQHRTVQVHDQFGFIPRSQGNTQNKLYSTSH